MDGIFYGIYMFRGKAGTVVVKRRQKLHLLYRRDLQGGLQPVGELPVVMSAGMVSLPYPIL